MKITEIEPATEKKLEEEAPASSLADDVPTTEETMDESLIAEEDFAEKLTVKSPALEPKAESTQTECKEESAQLPKAVDPAKEVYVSEASSKVPMETTTEEIAKELHTHKPVLQIQSCVNVLCRSLNNQFMPPPVKNPWVST